MPIDYTLKLSSWLKTEATKSRKQRRTLRQLHLELRALGYEGSYDRVAAFARRWKVDQLERVNSAEKSTTPVSAEMAVSEASGLINADRTRTISHAKLRADELRADMISRDVHEDVLTFCRDELVAGNYFQVVLEAVNSVLEKLRTLTRLTDDGISLIENALGGNTPRVKINTMLTDNQRSEQKGFANLLRGLVGMFRNTTAHEARINWPMSKEDAEDLLSVVSLAHRRLDRAIVANSSALG